MTKKILPAMVFFLAFLSGMAAADDITLDAAVETAVANNADLQRTAVAYRQAKRAKDYGWNLFLPQISGVSLGLSNRHQLYPEANAGGGSGSAWSVGSISLGASLTFTTDTANQLKLLDSRYRQAEGAYEKAVRDLAAAVTSSFYSLLAEKMNIEILKTDLELKSAQYNQINANYNRGLASELDMLNAQYTFQTAGPSLNTAVTRYRENLAAFFLLIGLNAENEPEPLGTIEIRYLDLPSVEELTALYLLSRSDIQTQSYALEQARLTASSRVRQMAPTLSISESISISPAPAGGIKIENPTVAGSFSLSVSIPINSWIPGSSQSLTRMNDTDTVALAEAALESAKKTAAQDIQKKVNAVIQNSENLESSDLNSRIAIRAYELTEQGYRAGLVSQTDLQSANQRRVSAEQSAVTTQINYLTAVSALASALNMEIAELHRLYGKE
jgi:multidrug efflux system outer membrane protein